MRIRVAAAIIVSVPLLVACEQPISPAGPTSSSPAITSAGADALATQISSERRMVPFKGSFEGVLTVSPPTAPPLLPSFIEATGNATHLGLFTLEVPHVVNTATRIGTGTFEFTAANGDMLIAAFVGVATVIGPGELSTADTATIIGGTGRFAGATGSFTGGRVFVIGARPVTGSFEGTISLTNGNQP